MKASRETQLQSLADHNRKIRNNMQFKIGLLILALFFVILNVFIYQTVDYNLNSDDASELMLAKILAKEGRIITDSWYYSSEIRFLNTQLVFAPLFLLTSNWHLVRCLGTAILQMVMLCSLYCLCKRSQCTRFFPFAGLMLILPFSEEYYSFVIRVPYYIPHISISFFT